MARKRPEYPAGLSDEAVDALIAEVKTPEQLDEVFRDLKRRLVERVLRAELTQHLGYPEGAGRPTGASNARNGTTPKTILTDEGALPLEIPRDRASTFTPQCVPHYRLSTSHFLSLAIQVMILA